MSTQYGFVEAQLYVILNTMFVIERFMFILIGITLIIAALLGIALYYHFSRFSPDKSVSVMTVGVYGIGVFAIALFTVVLMLLY